MPSRSHSRPTTAASKVSHRVDPVESGGTRKPTRFTGDVARKSATAEVTTRNAKSKSPSTSSRRMTSPGLLELSRCSSSMAMPPR